MAQSNTFALLYIETSENVNGETIASVADISEPCPLAVPPNNEAFCPLEQSQAASMQIVPIGNNASHEQEYILLTPMTTSEEKVKKTDHMPANRILAESVKGLFLSNDSQSSCKSLEDNGSTEACYFDVHYDDSSSEYAHSVTGNRKVNKRSRESGEAVDPFSDLCRIPLPGSIDGPYFDSKTFVRRRNERERARVRSVNEGFERLRAHLPYESDGNKQRRLSKVETLQYAIQYIQHLQSILDAQ